MSTEDIIRPILTHTYGDNGMSRALAVTLAERIDKYQERDAAYYGDRQRADMIRNVCWDWMTGGSTAEAVAQKIEEAIANTAGEENER